MPIPTHCCNCDKHLYDTEGDNAMNKKNWSLCKDCESIVRSRANASVKT